jgi:hypothetical protein
MDHESNPRLPNGSTLFVLYDIVLLLLVVSMIYLIQLKYFLENNIRGFTRLCIREENNTVD